jgi:glucose-6-phosphate 1-dehydrogenase
VRRETRKEQEIKVHFDEDRTNHINLQPCVVSRGSQGEALAIEPRQGRIRGAGRVTRLGGNTNRCVKYANWFPKEPDIKYETLIYDALMGDQTLVNRADIVEETCRVVGAVPGNRSSEKPASLPNYPSNSDSSAGPDAERAPSGHPWRPTTDGGKSNQRPPAWPLTRADGPPP